MSLIFTGTKCPFLSLLQVFAKRLKKKKKKEGDRAAACSLGSDLKTDRLKAKTFILLVFN